MRRFLTPDEVRLRNALPKGERAVLDALFTELGARLVAGAAGETVTPKGMSAGDSARPEPAVPATEPLFSMHKKEAA